MLNSKYFKEKEFDCKCGCGLNNIKSELVVILDDLREKFNSPCTVNSACRCESHNASVGGVTSSKHLWGNAVDISIKGFSTDDVYKYLDNKYPNSLGIGYYDTFIHIDLRKERTRWNESKFNKKDNDSNSFLDSIDFDMIGNLVTTVNPVAGMVIKGINAIVKSDNESISNSSTIDILESLSKSTDNNVDDKLICIVKAYLECKK
ncbi:MAG: hypothetical protein DRG78_03815 [Epsilonproteobacteria bacterium]|nr:MAG: hypothetical protein DRG78_03815 [Campylobacterota bacterium]